MMKKHPQKDGKYRKHWRIKSFRISGPQYEWIQSNGGGARIRDLIDAARNPNLFDAAKAREIDAVSPATELRRPRRRRS